jgi:hypothetical protein
LEKLTDFENFRKEKIDKQQKTKTFDPLSDDFVALQKDENGDYKKIDGPIEIVQILDIVKDEKEIEKIEEVAAAPVINTDLRVKKVKRGDIIYVTAMLEKPSGASWNAQTLSVLKCRIVDYYYGLNILNTLKNK